MVLIQFGAVVLRYVFGMSDIMVQESILYLHASLFMLGAGYTLLVDGHVRVDIFYGSAGRRTRAWIDLLGTLFLLAPACVALIVYTLPSALNSWAILEGPVSVGGYSRFLLVEIADPAVRPAAVGAGDWPSAYGPWRRSAVDPTLTHRLYTWWPRDIFWSRAWIC